MDNTRTLLAAPTDELKVVIAQAVHVFEGDSGILG